MLKVGLTGSIAVGKSFVLGVLAELGCHVIDADVIAREVVEPGQPGLSAVVEAFGSSVLQSDGKLDRSQLAAIVFGDEEKRQRLNAVLHPFIFAAQDARLSELERREPQSIAVVDAALMIESGDYQRFDRLIVVYCRPEVQLERLMTRDGFTEAEAAQRISSQMPQEEKKTYADFLIDSSDGFGAAREQTEKVFLELQTLADARTIRDKL